MRTLLTLTTALLLTLSLGQRAAAVADPDAKGTVTIGSSGPDPMTPTTLKVTGGRTAVAQWSIGAIQVFAARTNGGRVWPSTVVIDAEQPASWTASFPNMPNGTYTVWAYQTVTRFGNPSQLVGSQLNSNGTINVAGNPNIERVGGSVSFGAGSPARANGGAGLTSSGSYVTLQGYKLGVNEQGVGISMVTIPTDGGVVRVGNPTQVTLTSWQNATTSVPSTLTYNVVATMAVTTDAQNPPNPPDLPHNVVSNWVGNK